MDSIVAAKKVIKYNRGLLPISYCYIDGGIIINTKSLIENGNTFPLQYFVSNDGQVIPTNPLIHDYANKKFKRIKIQQLI